MTEIASKKRRISTKTILLVAVIAVLAGIVVVQQVIISDLRPIAYQETKTYLNWTGLSTLFYAWEVGEVSVSNSTDPSFVSVALNIDNSTCMTIDKACQGYDYYFNIENVCDNTTYYGTCNFTGHSVFWYDITRNVMFMTGLGNISIPQGQTVTFHGDWNSSSYPHNDDSMFLEVWTSGGWAAATTSIS